MWTLLSGCCSETPAPPSDYIDEVDMDTFAYIKYIPDWYVVPEKVEDRLILPIHFIDEIDMDTFALSSNSSYHPYPISNC